MKIDIKVLLEEEYQRGFKDGVKDGSIRAGAKCKKICFQALREQRAELKKKQRSK